MDNTIRKLKKDNQEMKKVLNFNLDFLLDCLKKGVDKSEIEQYILSLKGQFNNLQVSVDEKLSELLDENNVDEIWWKSLPPVWKFIFVFNIEENLSNVFEDNQNETHWGYSYDDITNSIYFEQYSLNDILYKLRKLKRVIIPNLSPIKNLDPLSKLTILEELEYKCINKWDVDLKPLSNLKKLNKLEIRGRIKNLIPLKNNINLKELIIPNNSSDISPISSQINLVKLNLGYNSSKDLSPLVDLKKLRELRFGYKLIISDVKHISKIQSLEKLTIISDETDLNELSNLINLKELYLSQESQLPREELDDFVFLKSLKNLKKLHIKLEELIFSREYDLSYISYLKNLKELSLGSNVKDLSFLKNLKNLKTLILHTNGENLGPLSNISILEELKLFIHRSESYESKELNLNPLSSMIHLKKLQLYGYDCDLDFLSNYKDLESLNLSGIGYSQWNNDEEWGNNSDLTPLMKLKNLKELNLHYNYSDIQPLSRLTNLERLTISDGNMLCFDQYDFNYEDSYSEYHNNKDLRKSMSLEPISKLEKLKSIEIYRNRSDLNPLGNLKKLKHLFLRNNFRSVEPLLNLSNLEVLVLTIPKNDYSYMKTIPKLENLRILLLNGFKIHLSPILGLQNLKKLSLNFRYLNDDDLMRIRKIDELYLIGIEVDESYQRSFLEKIKRDNDVFLFNKYIGDYNVKNLFV